MEGETNDATPAGAVAGLEALTSVGMSHPDPSALTAVLRIRLAATAALGLLLALMPLFGPFRLLIAVCLVAMELAANGYAMRVVRLRGEPTIATALADLLLTLTIVALVPEALFVAALVFTGINALNVFWYGLWRTAALATLAAAGFITIGILERPYLWATAVMAYAICSATTIGVLNTIAANAAEARRRYAALVNGLDAVVFEDSRDSPPVLAGNVADVLGTDPQRFSRSGFMAARVHPDDRNALDAARAQNDAGRSSETKLRILDDAGQYRQLYERMTVWLDADGTVAGRRGLIVDESDRFEAQVNVRRYADFIHGIPVALTVLRLTNPTDPESLVVESMNPAAEALFGRIRNGTPAPKSLPISPQWVDRLASVALGREPHESPFATLSGFEGTFAIRAVPLPERTVGVSFEDVTKRARLQESFKHQARHDALTGLANRANLSERLEVVTATDNGGRAALLLVDLNDFKEINDALGHEYGDRVLAELARRMSHRLRNCDLVARLGGDEFAVLITDCPGVDHALEVAARLIELCETPFEVEGFRFHVGASVGVATAPQHGTDGPTLMRHADSAMYEAKAGGGGVMVFDQSQERSNLRRLELMADLRHALTDDEFEVHYQPRIDLTHNRTVGLEALVRWRHPRHGLLPPDEFVELAEVSGNIRGLTESVGNKAAAEVIGTLGDHNLTLSVNLSSRSLYDPWLADWVGQLLETSGIPADRLCFEITETELMEDPHRSLPVLHEVRSHGVCFSVDDFGTGYSSLAYLRELPIDEIKIDRSFVSDLWRDATIVRSVIDLGHNLGLRVVAEGVEDERTESMLRAMGCDSAQGFRWGAAMPAPMIADHLTHSRPEARTPS